MRHRISRTTLLFGVVVAFVGCNLFGPETEAEVRFQNSTEDLEIYHGLKFGDAEFMFHGSETFQPGDVTSYKTTEEGTYSVQALDDQGNWLTLFEDPAEVEGGGKYTLVGRGRYPDIYGVVVVDEAP